MYFIGQTRFSLYIPGSNAWNVSNFTEEEYIAHLFSDERMSVRVNIFSEISIPLMNKMRKQYDFRHIVSYSSILPQKWKNILFNLQKKYPFLYLCEVDSKNENPLYSILKGKESGAVAFFRLDDDDLLSINYLDNLAKYNKSAYKNMAVSFGKGIAALYKQNNYMDFRNVVQQYPSMGQAYIGYWSGKNLELPPMYSHHNLDQNIPVIVDSANIMYLQTYHEQQDSNYRFSKATNIQEATVEAELSKYPKNKNSEQLIACFPVLDMNIREFSDKKTSYFSISNLEISKKDTLIAIQKNKDKCLFELEYEIILSKQLTSPKAIVFSFKFDQNVTVQSGLTFSSYNDIGWFKYICGSNGTANGTLSFILDKPAQLTDFRIIIWDDRFKSISIKSISIS
ncbi:glycosyltransferase [Neisseria musculi]|uniref:Rhamnosyl transferase family protein n=1 Tax=Neisseria musculi TaxID=1815583 RepID=A0A7H1MB90_9NEIS|nr:glycosyltransferase [Neisseria musculi]QNT58905.1 rhamnosyl transferase family protein [Neisseria musculi]